MFRRMAAEVCSLHRQQHEEVQPGQAGEVSKDVRISQEVFTPVVAQERGRHRPGPGLCVPQLRRGRAWWRGRGPRPPSHRPHQVSPAQELQIKDAEIGKRFLLVILLLY